MHGRDRETGRVETAACRCYRSIDIVREIARERQRLSVVDWLDQCILALEKTRPQN